MRAGIVITVTPEDRRHLGAIVRDRNRPQKHVWRARIILLTADGLGTNGIVCATAKDKTVVWRWQERFMRKGMAALTLDAYVASYAAFALHAREVGFVRYEDFVDRPDDTLAVVCEQLALPFDAGYRDRWSSYAFVTGDVHPASGSRGVDLGAIMMIPRRACEETLLGKLRESRDLRNAATALGYEF